MPDASADQGNRSEDLNLQTTTHLLAQVRTGSERARNLLVKRYLGALQRWAHGRLPRFARSLLDTDDLVQITLLRSFKHIEEFEPRGKGAFLAYLRQILLNQVREEIRKAARKPRSEALTEEVPVSEASPLEQAIGRQALKRYEAALTRLTGDQQEAVVLRIEMGFSYPEVAQALACSTANAARMLVVRGLVRLAEVMGESGK